MKWRVFGATIGLALSITAASDSLAQVGSVFVDKTRVYDQTATGVALKPPRTPCNFNCGFAFSARVYGTNIAGIPAPTVAGPVDSAAIGSYWNGGVMGYFADLRGWALGYPAGGEWDSPTQADLDAKFANGVYTLTVQGQAYPVSLTGDAYPSPPVMTIGGTGNWADGKFVFDPRFPLTVTNPGASPGLRYVGLLACVQNGGGCPYSAGNGNLPASITLPANTLADGTELFFVATDTAFVDEHLGPAGAPPQSYAAYNARTQVFLKAQIPQRFPMTVTSNITPTVANVAATIQYLPQDVGTTGSVYVFAVAPATIVKNVTKASHLGMTAKGGEKDDVPVQCVLAQLNSSGQLQAVTTSSLQAYVTGVLGGQGQAVTILNNIPTANVGGAALYVGYGSDPLSMITHGVNQRAASVPAALACDPKPPQTGWWWNTAEGGRGYSIEVAGNHIVFASYLYDVTGRATWLLTSGNTSLDGSLFTGKLESYSQGQTLTGAYKAPAGVVGQPITLAFNDASHGTLSWPGGTVAIERFNIVPNGLTLAVQANQPESGWWWNPAESGRGYFLEWQGGQLFMAGYMYDDAGNPIWYLSGSTTPSSNLQSYSNTWQLYGNGQTLTGAYKPATAINPNVGPVMIQFSGAETGIMTLPGGRTTPIRRFRF